MPRGDDDVPRKSLADTHWFLERDLAVQPVARGGDQLLERDRCQRVAALRSRPAGACPVRRTVPAGCHAGRRRRRCQSPMPRLRPDHPPMPVPLASTASLKPLIDPSPGSCHPAGKDVAVGILEPRAARGADRRDAVGRRQRGHWCTLEHGPARAESATAASMSATSKWHVVWPLDRWALVGRDLRRGPKRSERRLLEQ